jgi:hypothetical protein
MNYGGVLWLENQQEATKLLLMLMYFDKKMGPNSKCRVQQIS